jgi:hypothetical protein
MPKAAADTGAKKRTVKEKKDPNKPKRSVKRCDPSPEEITDHVSALSAYMFFVQDYRERIRRRTPRLPSVTSASSSAPSGRR